MGISDIIESLDSKADLESRNIRFVKKGQYKEVSDGYHTIGDLYEHRTYLFLL